VNLSGDTAILACDDGSYCCQPSLLSPSCCIANPPSQKFILDGNPTAETTIGSSTPGTDISTILVIQTTSVAAAPVSEDVIVTVNGDTTSTVPWQISTQIQVPTQTQTQVVTTKTQTQMQTQTQVVTTTMMEQAPATNEAGSSPKPWLVLMIGWALLDIWEGYLAGPAWLLLLLSFF